MVLNKDEIVRMAREVGNALDFASVDNWIRDDDLEPFLIRFANLVAAAENDTICGLLDRLVDTYENMDRQGSAEDIRKLIRHIRARGQR